MSITKEQKAHRERIVAEFTGEFRAKYDQGQLEHGGNLFEKSGLLEEAVKESIDQVCYLFTLREQERQRGRCDGCLFWKRSTTRAGVCYHEDMHSARMRGFDSCPRFSPGVVIVKRKPAPRRTS